MRERARHFLESHRPGNPLLMPNPWDVGTARLFASLGFRALATTSSGFAATLGRHDGHVSREESLAHADEIAGATALPVNADLENGFADDPAGVAETIRRARQTRIAGCSIEDWSPEGHLYSPALAAERVAAAAEAAHGEDGFVLTARAENYLRGVPDLDDTLSRLQSYWEAGADVVYAPGLAAAADIAWVVSAIDAPLNVLIWPGGPSVPQLARAGASRISVGGALSLAAHGAVVRAAEELLDPGTTGFFELADEGRAARKKAFD